MMHGDDNNHHHHNLHHRHHNHNNSSDDDDDEYNHHNNNNSDYFYYTSNDNDNEDNLNKNNNNNNNNNNNITFDDEFRIRDTTIPRSSGGVGIPDATMLHHRGIGGIGGVSSSSGGVSSGGIGVLRSRSGRVAAAHPTDTRADPWDSTTTSRRSSRPSAALRNRSFITPRHTSSMSKQPRKQSFPFIKYIQSCFIAGIPAYIVAIVFLLYYSKIYNNQDEQLYTQKYTYYQDTDSTSTNHQKPTKNSLDKNNKNVLQQQQLPTKFYQVIRNVQTTSAEHRQVRHWQLEKEEYNIILQTREQRSNRIQQRQIQTQPKSINSSQDNGGQEVSLLQSYEVLSFQHHETIATNLITDPNNKYFKPALETELCGEYARTASNGTPQFFRSKEALAKPKTARVLITGILSNPTGYRLAQTLAHQCGIQIMIGFDALHPNSFQNRLRYQEPMAILTKQISKLVKPFFAGHVGLDPIKHSKNFITLPDGSEELDIVKTFSPTHIVHLGFSNSANVFNGNHAKKDNTEWKNKQSPYVQEQETKIIPVEDFIAATAGGMEEEGVVVDIPPEQIIMIPDKKNPGNMIPSITVTKGENYDPPMFVLQNSIISMEQILKSIAYTEPDKRPQLIYASAFQSHTKTSKSISDDNNNTNENQNTDFDVMHEKARSMDEIMADFYYRQHGVYSVAIRLPTIFGPWDHVSSPMFQILRQEVLNATLPPPPLQNNTDSTNTNAAISEGDQQQGAIVGDDSSTTTTIAPKLPPPPPPTISSYFDNVQNPESFDLGWLQQEVDLMYVDDVVDAIIAMMQYRPEGVAPRPQVMELSSGETRTLQDIQNIVKNIIQPMKKYLTSRTPTNIETLSIPSPRNPRSSTMDQLKRMIMWSPHVTLANGLVRTVAWHLDRVNPYGPPPPNTPTSIAERTDNSHLFDIYGEALLKHWSIPLCPSDDALCHGGLPNLPCASECAMHKPGQCIPTALDKLIPLVQELTEDCDIVLYTQDFNHLASDLELSPEFMDEGDPLVCNFAFIHRNSNLTNSVIEKVPDTEVRKLGIEESQGGATDRKSVQDHKLDSLNGRLLYRGWILIWADFPNAKLRQFEEFLLKLSPGRFFHKDVEVAVFIDQTFGVSPRADDIAFLAHEMYRKPLEPRVVKRKIKPKAKFLLPPEPERQAVVLLPELKYLDSPDAERLPPGEKISIYEATRFMRFEIGEPTPLGKEPPEIRTQREFYERARSYINTETVRSPNEPRHKFDYRNWVRTRWVAHDLKHDESRTQLRCPWYHEHTLWGNSLDQFSFAFVLQKLELQRKLHHKEPDDEIQKGMSEHLEMKKLFSDLFEWVSLETEAHKSYSPYDEMSVLPYDLDYVTDAEKQVLWEVDRGHFPGDPRGVVDSSIYHPQPLLFIRLISDRIMAQARKSWNLGKKHRLQVGQQKAVKIPTKKVEQ